MPDYPCCDCCIDGDDCEGTHCEPCDIHQLPDAERENLGWSVRREE